MLAKGIIYILVAVVNYYLRLLNLYIFNHAATIWAKDCFSINLLATLLAKFRLPDAFIFVHKLFLHFVCSYKISIV